MVQDGVAGTRSLYVNGTLAATGIAQAANGAGDLWLGQQNLLLTQPDSFPGYLDEIRIYNTALSATRHPGPAQPSAPGGHFLADARNLRDVRARSRPRSPRR